jgi:hypothetical protein
MRMARGNVVDSLRSARMARSDGAMAATVSHLQSGDLAVSESPLPAERAYLHYPPERVKLAPLSAERLASVPRDPPPNPRQPHLAASGVLQGFFRTSPRKHLGRSFQLLLTIYFPRAIHRSSHVLTELSRNVP